MKEEKEFDKCIFCNKETKYTKDVPVHMRFFYIEGMGQLCSRCYEKYVGT